MSKAEDDRKKEEKKLAKKAKENEGLERSSIITRQVDEHLKKMAKKAKPLKGAVHTYTTGLIVLDYYINAKNPGIPGGSIYQLCGEGGAGKTTHALNICKQHMQDGNKVIYVDQEDGLRDSILEGFGWSKYGSPNFQYIPACPLEDVPDLFATLYEIVRDLQGDPTPLILVIDSIPFLKPPPSYDSGPKVGGNNQVLNNFLTALRPIIGNTNVLVLLLNGVYVNIMDKYVDYVVPGGVHLGRCCDLITVHYKRNNPSNPSPDERHSHDINKNIKITTRQKLGVKILKNKFANSNPSFSTLSHFFNTDLRFGEFGLDNTNSMLSFLKDAGRLKYTHPTFTLKNTSMYWKKWEAGVLTDPAINSLVLDETISALQDIFINPISANEE